MRAAAWVVAAAVLVAGCKKDGAGDGTKAGVAPAVTSPAIDALLAAVPGSALALGFVDLNVAPWTYLTGGAGLLDEPSRVALDKELRAYVERFVGIDVTRLQYAVGFVAGPPVSGAILVKTVGGAPAIPGAQDYEGARVWAVDRGVSLAMKGDTVVVGTDDAVRAVIDTMAQKRKSVVVENKPLVDWLHAETKGAAAALVALAPASMSLPLPPAFAGLSRFAVALGRERIRAVVDGEAAAITALHQLVDQQIDEGLAQAEVARAEAVAGNIPPPAGAMAIVGAAYAKSFVAKVRPRREGNRLVSTFDLQAQGTEAMMIVSTVGILAAVAIPAFMDYMKKSKKSEAAMQLNRLGKTLKIVYTEQATFPVGDAPLTPAESCCATGGRCPPDPAAWRQPVWQALDFAIDEPSMFQYRYRSDGTTAVVEAIGDLDCDGVTITHRLEASVTNGMVTATITEPAPNSD